MARSVPSQIILPRIPEEAQATLFLPGRSLAMELASRYFHGPLPEGTVLDLHPFALAAWVGLLATALNLLPLGQLDGGHVLYAATGSVQRRLARYLWAAVAIAGLFLWRGWLLWAVAVLFMGLRHPPVWDESLPLDRGRRWISLLTLLIFLLAFMPVPISLVPVAG